jgi:hypothetical protein
MVNSKSGGKNVSVLDLSALRPPKHVTSSTLQQAKKSALASKTQMPSVKGQSSTYVVKVSAGTPAGTARTLSREELTSLRETKRLVASMVRQELAASKK